MCVCVDGGGDGGDGTGGGVDGSDIQVPADDGGAGYATIIADLQAQIAALQGQESTIVNNYSDTTEVSGNTALPDDYLTEEMLAKYLNDLDLGSNAYDPAAFLNAYGFAFDPSMMASMIPTFNQGGNKGVYQRRAVKDKDTGEIRYVNVPIGMQSLGGNNSLTSFRNERRSGFGSFV